MGLASTRGEKGGNDASSGIYPQARKTYLPGDLGYGHAVWPAAYLREIITGCERRTLKYTGQWRYYYKYYLAGH
jgi:hypothetical protein